MERKENFRCHSFLFLFLLLLAPILSADQYDDYVKKGRDHFGLFQWDKAEAMFKRAIALDPSRFDAYFHLGMNFRKLNNIPGAVEALEKAYKINREDTDTARGLCAMYAHMAKEARQGGNRARMLEFMEKACKVYPQNTQNWAGFLGELVTGGSWNDIIKHGNTIINTNREALQLGDDRNLQKALICVAKAYKQIQDHRNARVFIKHAGRISNPDEELLNLKNELGEEAAQVAGNLLAEGRALFDKGDYKGAVAKLEKATGAEAGDPEINDLLELARKTMAVTDFSKASREAEAKGDYHEALEKSERALSFDSENVELQTRVASISEYIRKTEKAAADEKRRREAEARKLRTDEAERKKKLDFFLDAAKSAEEAENFDTAKENLEKALEAEPENELVKTSLERVQRLAREAKDRLERTAKALLDAETDIKAGTYDRAHTRLTELSRETEKPGRQLLVKLLATSYYLEKDEEMAGHLAKLEALDADAKEFHFYSGALAYRAGEYAKAATALGKAAKKDQLFHPDLNRMIWSTRLHSYKGPIFCMVFLFLFFIGGALKRWLTEFLQNQESGRIDAYITKHEYERLIPLLEKRLTVNSYLPKNHCIALGEAYLKTSRYPDAKRVISDLLSKEQKNPAGQRIMGEACFQLKENAPEAIDRIVNLYKLEETRKDVLTFLVSHFKSVQADNKTALDLMFKQVVMNPDDEDTLLHLAEHYGKRAQFSADSLKVFERAVLKDPDRPAFVYGLAQSYLLTGKKEEALKAMEQGRERWPGHELFRQDTPGTRQKTGGSRSAGAGESGNRNVLPTQKIAGESPTSSVATGSGSSAARTVAVKASTATSTSAKDSITCRACGAENSSREYYCTTCGKPLS